MKCPGDGGEMKKIAVVGIDDSFRCEKCGGVWVEGWVINSMAEGKELRITRYDIRDTIKDVGQLICPEDGSKLGLGSGGGTLPEGIVMYKCYKCRKWWLPGEAIFELADAFAVRKEYMKSWKKKSDLSVFTLPVILTAVLILGLGMIIRQVQLRQMLLTQAAVVRSTDVRYLGEGRAEVKMMVNGDLGVVEYRLEGEREWQQAATVSQGQWQVAVITGVTPGQKFLLRWNRGVVQLRVGEQQ